MFMDHSEATRHVYRCTRDQVSALVPWFLSNDYWFHIETAGKGDFWLTCAIEPSRLPSDS